MTAPFVAAVVVALSVVSATLAAQTREQNERAAPSRLALVETWPDGRTHYELTSPRSASMWTPAFPRVAGYQLPEGGKPVWAVQIARVLVGRNIMVDVSVLLGAAERPAVPVASVVVTPGSPFVIDALTRFGVQPLTLSMAEVVPLTSFLPTVVGVSAQVDIAAVELLDAPYPGYRITLRNLGSRAVANVHLQSYRGHEKALSTLKRSNDGRPLMKPGDSYTFDLSLTSDAANDSATPGTWAPRPIDLIEFDSVRWDDGTYEGTPLFPDAEAVIDRDSGRRLQLRRIIDTLRAVLTESSTGRDLLNAASERIARLPDAEPDQLEAARLAMRTTKRTVRADLTGLAARRSPQSDDVREYLTLLLRRYEAWLARLSPP